MRSIGPPFTIKCSSGASPMTMTTGRQQPNPNLDPVDRAALKACIDIMRRDPERGDQIDSKLRQSWQEAAHLTCFACQMKTLALKPWQSPLFYLEEDDPNLQ